MGRLLADAVRSRGRLLSFAVVDVSGGCRLPPIRERPPIVRGVPDRGTVPADHDVDGVLSIPGFQVQEDVLVVREPVQVLDEQLQLLIGQPLIVPLVVYATPATG
ncbi:hypothetical protein [Streptomyces exfoliatus]|uniref:hypothetical protein n=1 Tax=Streptomyces exfoliatus TaxID=1905 RepID=UPI0012FEDDA1|nr:hypothetical protein [Streptomyces exfoliatus]